MFPDEKKLARLTSVAKMYYEQDMSQDAIAKTLSVSRPMVSKLLSEAKRFNIISVTINEIDSIQEVLQGKLEESFCLKEAIVLRTIKREQNSMAEKIASAMYDFCFANSSESLSIGIGCGSSIGWMINKLERENIQSNCTGYAFPLIGALRASYMSYNTDELVRKIEEHTKLKAQYLYLPALVESADEKALYKSSELYGNIEKSWQSMDTALINVSNLYSSPDFATQLRFGNSLKTKNAVGRFLAYYYDINGNILLPENDNAMQVELEYIKNTKKVVAVCVDTVDSASAIGALKTGLFTHCILSDVVAQQIIEKM